MASKLIAKMKSGQMKFEVNVVIDCTQLIQAMTKNSSERRAELEMAAMEIVKFMNQHNIEPNNMSIDSMFECWIN